jgi:hypothetical protein
MTLLALLTSSFWETKIMSHSSLDRIWFVHNRKVCIKQAGDCQQQISKISFIHCHPFKSMPLQKRKRRAINPASSINKKQRYEKSWIDPKTSANGYRSRQVCRIMTPRWSCQLEREDGLVTASLSPPAMFQEPANTGTLIDSNMHG